MVALASGRRGHLVGKLWHHPLLSGTPHAPRVSVPVDFHALHVYTDVITGAVTLCAQRLSLSLRSSTCVHVTVWPWPVPFHGGIIVPCAGSPGFVSALPCPQGLCAHQGQASVQTPVPSSVGVPSGP